MGRNIPQYSIYFHFLIRLASVAASFAPILWFFLYFYRRAVLSIRFPVKQGISHYMIAWGSFSLILAMTEAWIEDWVAKGIFQLGHWVGCEYHMSRMVITTTDGPFVGGPGHALFNIAHNYIPWMSSYIFAFAIVLIVYHAGLRRLVLRVSRSQCLQCGYSLLGLSGQRCPECGNPYSTSHQG